MKRKEGESFEAYRERRKLDNESTEKNLKGKKVKYTKKEARNKARELAKNFRGNINL